MIHLWLSNLSDKLSFVGFLLYIGRQGNLMPWDHDLVHVEREAHLHGFAHTQCLRVSIDCQPRNITSHQVHTDSSQTCRKVRADFSSRLWRGEMDFEMGTKVRCFKMQGKVDLR